MYTINFAQYDIQSIFIYDFANRVIKQNIALALYWIMQRNIKMSGIFNYLA